MGRAFKIYDLPQSGAHQHATSTGTADFKIISTVQDANAMLITVTGATSARVKFDGTNPTAGTDGLVFPAGGAAILLPFARQINFCAETAATVSLDVTLLA